MTNSQKEKPNNNLIESLMRTLTNFANELSRIRRHYREDKNEVIDEMCRQKKELEKEVQFQRGFLRDIKDTQTSLTLDLHHLREVVERMIYQESLEGTDEFIDD